MDFWATFWATMWGALAGALVGAVAAWLFALDLARRSRRAEYAARMDAAITRFVTLLHGMIATPETVPKAIRKRREKHGWNAESDQLFTAQMEIRVISDRDDAVVLMGLQRRILDWVVLRGERLDYQVICDYSAFLQSALETMKTLERWRRGEITGAEADRLLRVDPSDLPTTRQHD
ncbi:hypothetical protein [uncultured Microbacterium sp.]|uniref:hypothetical protein n=1 Tax=uncultured Microbacterium sp. TaxID=191216 RepID=UPI0028F12F4D|nr:hypothetical protein [uncultured Microbacterium sp.]